MATGGIEDIEDEDWSMTGTSGASGSTQNATVTSLQDAMKEQLTLTETSTKDKPSSSRNGLKLVSSEPGLPGKVKKDKKGKGASSANRRSSGGETGVQDTYPDYDTLSKLAGMKVINVHKKDLMKKGFNNLENWVKVTDHVYISSDMSRKVPGAIGSKWSNPFKSKNCSREQICQQFKDYIRTNKKIQENGKTLYESLDELKGKILGCWCHPERCHGHALMELVSDVCKETDSSIRSNDSASSS